MSFYYRVDLQLLPGLEVGRTFELVGVSFRYVEGEAYELERDGRRYKGLIFWVRDLHTEAEIEGTLWMLLGGTLRWIDVWREPYPLQGRGVEGGCLADLFADKYGRKDIA